MTKVLSSRLVLIPVAVLAALFGGCAPVGHGGYAQAGPAPMVVAYEDDYLYYPGYEVYYSRTRHEYVYRDGNAWVRRSEPRGVSVNVLLAAPSVQMDFRDPPDRHHASVVKSYPKSWKPPAPEHGNQKSQGEKKENDKHGDDRKDQDEGRKN